MIKKLIKKIIFGYKANQDTFIRYLREKGVRIGENLYIVNPRNVYIDMTRPWMIEIGNDVVLTEGVTILTHGYDLSVLMNCYGDVFGSCGKVKIGNNVFIGVKSTILKGVEIGNNVIIGANSLVNKNVPDNVVVAGNPARIIMTLDEYYKKREKEYLSEAKEMIREYINVYSSRPTHKELREHFSVYLSREDEEYIDYVFSQNKIVIDKFRKTKPIYKGINEFIDNSLK